MSVIVSFSGGMDSATLLTEVAKSGTDTLAVSFKYPSKHNKYETATASKFAHALGVSHTVVDVSSCFAGISSNLLLSGGSIPEGHYEDATMKQTVVPGRNTIFLSILMGMAESLGSDKVFLGIHSGDHAIYPDCRPHYFSAAQKLCYAATEGRVGLSAPYLNMNKTDILRRGLSLGAEYGMTRTCYKDQEHACGRCGACVERSEAFHSVGVPDPANPLNNPNQ